MEEAKTIITVREPWAAEFNYYVPYVHRIIQHRSPWENPANVLDRILDTLGSSYADTMVWPKIYYFLLGFYTIPPQIPTPEELCYYWEHGIHSSAAAPPEPDYEVLCSESTHDQSSLLTSAGDTLCQQDGFIPAIASPGLENAQITLPKYQQLGKRGWKGPRKKPPGAFPTLLSSSPAFAPNSTSRHWKFINCIIPNNVQHVASPDTNFAHLRFINGVSDVAWTRIPENKSLCSLQQTDKLPSQIANHVPSKTVAANSVPAPLPPSVEEAYRKKCIELKRRMQEVEESNKIYRLRKERLTRGIRKMRLERAYLLEILGKRMKKNGGSVDGLQGIYDEESEGSSEGPPTPHEKPLRSKRSHRRPVASPPANPDHHLSHQNAQFQPPYQAPSFDHNPAYHPMAPTSNGHSEHQYQTQASSVPSSARNLDPGQYISPIKPVSAFSMYFETNFLSQAHKHPRTSNEEDLYNLALESWKNESEGKRQLYFMQENRQRQNYEAHLRNNGQYEAQQREPARQEGREMEREPLEIKRAKWEKDLEVLKEEAGNMAPDELDRKEQKLMERQEKLLEEERALRDGQKGEGPMEAGNGDVEMAGTGSWGGFTSING